MKKLIILSSLFCLILLFCGCHQSNREPSVNTDENISASTDQNISTTVNQSLETTGENYDDLLRQAHESYEKLDSLYTDNQADFTAAAKAVLKLPESKVSVNCENSGNSVESVYVNGESALFTELFNEDEQKLILTCLEKMKTISPENTKICIRKSNNYGSESIRFEFRVQDIWMDQGLAYCEQNLSAISNTYTHITENFYKFSEGLV